jgi:hypothetical protein
LVASSEPRVAAEPAKPAEVLYERAGAGGRVSVRGFRLLLALTLVNTALLASSVLGPQLFPFARGQWQQWQDRRAEAKRAATQLALQQQCMTHAVPEGRVVYEEDPQESMRLFKEGGGAYVALRYGAGGSSRPPPGWVPPVFLQPPAYFPAYLDAMFGARVSGTQDPVLFLHERTTPGGARRVVCVQLRCQPAFDVRGDDGASINESGSVFFQEKLRTLSAQSWPADPAGPRAARNKRQRRDVKLVLPDTRRRSVARLRVGATVGESAPIDYGNALRFFAGRPDPGDASHFTIKYELDGREGVIDGWQKDGTIELRAQDCRWLYDNDGEAWELGGRPALYPATPAKTPQ